MSNSVPGFTTSMKSRPLIVAKLEEFIRNKLIKVYSSRITNEMKTFIWNRGKATAQRSYNDDLIMSLALAIYGYKNIIDTTTIEHISKIPHKDTLPMPSKQLKHAFRGPGGQMEIEDLRWLMK